MSYFSKELIAWYHNNKRDLPWRNTRNPYKIWLSEVILQQTRVQQGLPYYEKFISNYPTVSDLAKATEMEILKLWQGLGYYSRARNLLKTARFIVDHHQGNFPKTYHDLLRLPGIGPYTAAAIASFSNNERVAVVDGNVYRVLARLFNISTPIDGSVGKKEFAHLANEILSHDAANHNQAIMEFGATVCTPRLAGCETCFFREKCLAFAVGKQYELPIKGKKSEVKTRHFNYLVFNHGDTTYLKQRQKGDIWQGLYDFPLIETHQTLTHSDSLTTLDEFQEWNTARPVFRERSETYRHLLSHREILATFWEFEIQYPTKKNSNYISIDNHNPTSYPVPQLIANYLKNKKKANS